MYQNIKTCICCGNQDLFKYLDLGNQPLANSYHTVDEKLETIPLQVNVCKSCFHNQLSVVVNPDFMFKNYLYVSGTTETLKNHFNGLATDTLNRINPIDPIVCDIACNDGSLLESFRNGQALVYGVDPAENLRPITEEKNIPVIVDYWNDKILNRLPKFDAITATNVFAHVIDAKGFLETCKKALQKNGIIVLEFPYAMKMLKNIEFDTIYHEHLSYFLVNSMKKLCDRVGLTIIDVIETPIHGGSIRFILSKDIKNQYRFLNSLIEQEKKYNLLDIEGYKVFQSEVDIIKESLNLTLKKHMDRGIPIVGYGASAKGNTLLNYCNINLKYIVDDNSLKWEYLTPGMNIPIKPSKLLESEEKILVVVILSWNFFREIQQKILHMRKDKKTILITYEPNVKEFSYG